MRYIEAIVEKNSDGQDCFSLAEPIPPTACRVEFDASKARFVVYEAGDAIPDPEG